MTLERLGRTRSRMTCSTLSARSSARRTCLSLGHGRWAILSHFDLRWAGTVTLQNLADAMGGPKAMRQIETVGLRKAEASGRMPSNGHPSERAGRRRVRTGESSG